MNRVGELGRGRDLTGSSGWRLLGVDLAWVCLLVLRVVSGNLSGLGAVNQSHPVSEAR